MTPPRDDLLDRHDLDTWLARAGGVGVPLGFDNLPIPGTDIGYQVFDGDNRIDRFYEQKFSFTPDFDVTLVFDQAVQYWVRQPDNILTDTGSSASVTFRLGNSIDFVYPPALLGTLGVTPTFSMSDCSMICACSTRRSIRRS